jgi:hypothetical protein
MWLQQLALVNVSGTPNIEITISGIYWTDPQNALPLSNPYTFASTGENQELELPPNQSIVITITGGTGSLLLNAMLAQGV